MHYHRVSLQEQQSIANQNSVFVVTPVSATQRDCSIALAINCSQNNPAKFAIKLPVGLTKELANVSPVNFVNIKLFCLENKRGKEKRKKLLTSICP